MKSTFGYISPLRLDNVLVLSHTSQTGTNQTICKQKQTREAKTCMPKYTTSEQTIVQSYGSTTDQPRETRTNNKSHHSELNTSVDFHDLEESMKSRLIWLVFFFSSLSRELEGFGGWE